MCVLKMLLDKVCLEANIKHVERLNYTSQVVYLPQDIPRVLVVRTSIGSMLFKCCSVLPGHKYLRTPVSI